MTGDPTSISLDGENLWVVAYLCPKPTLAPGNCPSRLLTYDVGTLVPTSSQPIPVERPAVFPEARLLRRLGPTEESRAGGRSADIELVFRSDPASLVLHVIEEVSELIAGSPKRARHERGNSRRSQRRPLIASARAGDPSCRPETPETPTPLLDDAPEGVDWARGADRPEGCAPRAFRPVDAGMRPSPSRPRRPRGGVAVTGCHRSSATPSDEVR